jgi:murein DD-endopeptidase MepM/ murein hydrolase activator NlpD
MGLYTQQDPIGIAGGLNLYGYANGDPVNYSDPFGLCPMYLTGRPCQNPLGGAALTVRISESNLDVGMFGPVRNGGRTQHRGVDILAIRGSNVTSVDDGFVLDIQNDVNGGNLIKIGHNNAAGDLVSVSVYMHLQEKPDLAIGAPVSGGQLIGKVGRTGNITNEATHLHFELRTQIFGGQIDPTDELGVNH